MASLKIFHCADLHLGKRYRSYPEGVAEQLREARFVSLERMVETANAEGCQLFVVAGDLFDTLTVPKAVVTRAAQILGRFDGVLAVLPGNHDFHAGAGDEFWKGFEPPEHPKFLLLAEHRAYPLNEFGLDAVLYPAACGRKHSSQHALGWIAGCERVPARYQVGIAHGSFEGLSPDIVGDYFPMKASDLERLGLDLWLLGHIHVPFPVKAGDQSRIFYPGTHEPDGMDCRHEGHSWLLELGEDKRVAARSVSTGTLRFEMRELTLRSLGELEAYAAGLGAEGSRLLLRLILKGALEREELARVGAVVEKLQGQVLHLEPRLEGLTVALSSAEIDREFPPGSFAHRLLTELAAGPGDREALQAAFALLKECAP